MAWLRIDDGFAQHPKVVQLVPRDRWTWLEILCYCARYRTEGHVPHGIGEVVRGASPTFLQRCEQLHLLDIAGDDYHVHDWRDYNGKDAKVLVKERVRKHRERNADVTPSNADQALQKRYSRVGARARSRPVPSPTPELPRDEDLVLTPPLPEPELQDVERAGAENHIGEEDNPWSPYPAPPTEREWAEGEPERLSPIDTLTEIQRATQRGQP